MHKDLNFLKEMGLLNQGLFEKLVMLIPELDESQRADLRKIIVDCELSVCSLLNMDLQDLQVLMQETMSRVRREVVIAAEQRELLKESQELKALENLINEL